MIAMPERHLPLLAGAIVVVTACSSALSPPTAPATTMARGSCTIVVTRPGGDWSRWDEQLCHGVGPSTDQAAWLASLAARAVDDAEIAACGAPRCAAEGRAVRFYVIPSNESRLESQSDDQEVAVVLSSALVDHMGHDGGFYELAFAHELARLRLGVTCGEGVQSSDALRDAACDQEALRWLTSKQPGDEAWARRAQILAEARAK